MCCTALRCAVLRCAVLRYTVLCCIAAVLCCAELCFVALCCAVLRCAALCSALLCSAVRCGLCRHRRRHRRLRCDSHCSIPTSQPCTLEPGKSLSDSFAVLRAQGSLQTPLRRWSRIENDSPGSEHAASSGARAVDPSGPHSDPLELPGCSWILPDLLPDPPGSSRILLDTTGAY